MSTPRSLVKIGGILGIVLCGAVVGGVVLLLLTALVQGGILRQGTWMGYAVAVVFLVGAGAGRGMVKRWLAARPALAWGIVSAFAVAVLATFIGISRAHGADTAFGFLFFVVALVVLAVWFTGGK